MKGKSIKTKEVMMQTNHYKESVVWNMLASIAYSFQSALFLLIISRVAGLAAAGVFTISYSVSQMFASVGTFSMRSFQVSDTKGKYKSGTYFGSRIVTVVIMFLLCLSYAIWHGYTGEKMILIFLFCLYRVTDCLDDVWHGEIQKRNRLDLAARNMFVRICGSSFVFLAIYIFTKNAIVSAAALFVVALLISLVLNLKVLQLMKVDTKPSFNDILLLLWECLPICLGAFLYNYINNSPKYAIDALLTDESQTIFNIVYMPVFVMSMLGSFIYNPSISRMGKLWNEHKLMDFVRVIGKQILAMVAIGAVIWSGAFIFGIPVLSLVFGVDLHEYKSLLMLLLGIGIVVALNAFANVVLTVIRKQQFIMMAYACAALFSIIYMEKCVGTYALVGAGLAYGASMLLILVICILVATLTMLREKRRG